MGRGRALAANFGCSTAIKRRASDSLRGPSRDLVPAPGHPDRDGCEHPHPSGLKDVNVWASMLDRPDVAADMDDRLLTTVGATSGPSPIAMPYAVPVPGCSPDGPYGNRGHMRDGVRREWSR